MQMIATVISQQTIAHTTPKTLRYRSVLRTLRHQCRNVLGPKCLDTVLLCHYWGMKWFLCCILCSRKSQCFFSVLEIPKLLFPTGYPDAHIMHSFLGLLKSTPQTESGSVEPFCRAYSWDQQTGHAACDICSSRLLLATSVSCMWCSLVIIITLAHTCKENTIVCCFVLLLF